MAGEMELLRRLYDRFNARDIEGVLAALHNDVLWANGWEGGHVAGHAAVRDYWIRQWQSIDPRVEPIGFSTGPDGEVVVEVRQVVRDPAGKLLADRVVEHVFRVEGGQIRRFDIGASKG
jgi:ketosteroid isomerase-like protein